MRFKKFLCYLLCGILTFTVISTANYKSAHAMEWVSGALSFAETLTWVLASLGITCTVSDYASEVDKSRSEFWEDYEQDFYDYVNEHDGNTASDRFIEWKNKLCKGVLDKSSEYWSLFKDWAVSLFDNSSGSETIVSGSAFSDVFSYMVTTMNMTNYTSYRFANYNADTPIYSGFCYFNDSNYPYLVFFPESGVYSMQGGRVYKDGARYRGAYMYSTGNYYGEITIKGGSDYNTLFESFTYPKLFLFHFNWISPSLDGYSGLLHSVNDSLSDEIYFDSTSDDISNLDVISSDGVDEDSPEVTLPYPGVSDSDNEASQDAYQDIIDAINDGTITQEQGIEKIQEILKVITYDTVTDEVVPPQKNDDGTDKTKDDALKENKENMGFTLGGLEAVFPFCIPFDIYAFMTLLVAEPVCPEFDFPIKSVNGQVEEIHVDLEPFEPVAVVVRYCFDFLFIIGLAMLTRSLIGGGSSD